MQAHELAHALADVPAQAPVMIKSTSGTQFMIKRVTVDGDDDRGRATVVWLECEEY